MLSRFFYYIPNPFELMKSTVKIIKNAVGFAYSTSSAYLMELSEKLIFRKYYLLQKLSIESKDHPDGIAHAQLNSIEGNICFIRPTAVNDHVKIKKLLQMFDAEESGRKGYDIFKKFAGDSVMFANTNEEALKHRKRLLPYTVAKDYGPLTQEAMRDYFTAHQSDDLICLTEKIPHIIRSILAKRILGIKSLPEEMNQILDAAADECAYYTGGSFISLTFLLPFDFKFKKIKTNYQRCIKEIFTKHVDDFFAIVQNFVKSNSNLIIDEVIALIKKEQSLESDIELQSYLKCITKEEFKQFLFNPCIINLPFVLIAAENLIFTIKGAINIIFDETENEHEYALYRIQSQIDRYKILDNDVVNLEAENQVDGQSYVDLIYKESLRMFPQPAAWRYSKDEHVMDDIRIPKNSMVLFGFKSALRDASEWHASDLFLSTRFAHEESKNIKLHQFPLMPFSVGPRSCPFAKVTQEIYKTVMYLSVAHHTRMKALRPVKKSNINTIRLRN